MTAAAAELGGAETPPNPPAVASAREAEAAPARPAYFETGWTGGRNPWAIALVVTLATFMEVLDTSIANVSLPKMAGDLSVSQDESTWVLTSYLVANAIVLPISGWLATRFGRKRFYMTCVALFTISSFLCGFAPSLGWLVFFRICQGIGGGGLGPSEQAILADTFPPAKRGVAFAMYGMAVVLAPAIGPTLGGFITDNFSWRWVFYINVPRRLPVAGALLTSRMVTDPPHLIAAKAKGQGARIDYIGISLIALGLGALEIVLDKGQEDDWFSSRFILIDFLIVAVGRPLGLKLRRLGVAPGASRRRRAALQGADLRHRERDDVRARRHALRHHCAPAAVPAGPDGVFGRGRRDGAVARRVPHHGVDARRRLSRCRASTRARSSSRSGFDP